MKYKEIINLIERNQSIEEIDLTGSILYILPFEQYALMKKGWELKIDNDHVKLVKNNNL